MVTGKFVVKDFSCSFSLFLFQQILKGRPMIDGRPGESLEALDFDALKSKLQEEYGKKGVWHLLSAFLLT